nr:hypothetical protein L195_g004257 [Ipomoea batatas]
MQQEVEITFGSSPISFAFALNKCFCIFPVAVFGNGPNITDFGTQYFGIFDRLKLIISPAKRSRSESFTSGFGVTNAQGDSPHCSSGLATTDTSSIAGCWDGLHVLGADDIELFQKYSLEQYYAIHLEVASMQSLGHRFPRIVHTQLRLSLEHIEAALDHSLTAANECPNKKAIVSAFRRTLTAFKTAPAIGIPKWASYKAGTFGATTAT